MSNEFISVQTRVNLNNPKDIIKYTEEWHISKETLKTAVDKVGTLKTAVAYWLKDNGYL